MSQPPDPPRLLDDPGTPAAVRDLLASAAPTPGPNGAQAGELAARVARIGSPSLAPPAPASPPASLPWGWLGLAAVATVGVGLFLGSPDPAAPAVPTPSRVPVAAPPAPPAPRPPAAPVRSATAVDDADETPAVTAVRPTPVRRPRREPAPDLEAEQALVEAARRDLEGNPAAALAQLERHGVRFAHGQLAAERDFLAIRALRRLGRDDEVRARSTRFLADHPDSPYARLLGAGDAR